MTKKTHYTYEFIVDGKIVHGGITIDPKRREEEHQQEWPRGRLVVVGGPMSEEDARAWEKANGYS